MIELRALGGLRLRDSADGHEILSVLARAKPPGLLVYLALSPPNEVHGRDALFPLLWPGSSPEKARNSLSQVLHILRRGLGPGVIRTTDDDDVFLEAGAVWCDVVAFEDALASGHEREALELYGGHLWDGSDLSDCPAFERWLDRERQRLRLQAVEAAVTLAHELERDGSYVDAAQWLRRARDWAPYDEAVMRSLLRLLHGLGEGPASVREYEAYEKRLADVELTPSTDMSELIEKIRGSTAKRETAGAEAVGSRAVGSEPIVLPMPQRKDPSLASVTTQPRVSWPTGVRAAAAIVVLGAIAAVGAAVGGNSLGDAPALDPTRVLVDVFRNDTGDPSLDALGRMAIARITDGLTYTGLMDVVSLGTPLMSREPVVTDTGSTERSGGLQTLARANGTGTVLWGSYYLQGDSLHFVAHVTDATTGEDLATLGPVREPVDAPLAAIERLRDQVMTTLATLTDPRLAKWMRYASQPPTFEAYQAFVEGIELFATSGRNPWAAAAQFVRAAALDSTFTIPLLWAITAYDYQGSVADSIAQDLNRRRDQLALLDRHFLDYSLARVRLARLDALFAIRRVLEIAPNSQYLALAAETALTLNRPQLAIEFLMQGDPKSGWLPAQWAYWGGLALAYHTLGDHRKELEEVHRGQSQLPNRDNIRFQEMRALAALGRTEELDARIQELFGLTSVQGLRMAQMARELRAHGYGDAATELLYRAIEWFEHRSPEQKRSLRERRQLAAVFLDVGRLDEAQVLLEGLLEDGPARHAYLAELGVVAARRGDREGASRISRLLEEADPSLNLPGGRSDESAYERAWIAAALGERERAMELLLRSDLRGGPSVFRAHADPRLEPLWDYPPFQEFLRPKG